MSKNARKTKRGGRHTTLIDAAQPLYKFACSLPEIKKISPGIIKAGIKGGQQSFKLKDINGGLLVVVRGSTCIQELRIYSDSPKIAKQKIADFCLQ